MQKRRKIILIANTDWYLYNFRRSLARDLMADGWEVVLASPPGPYTSHFEDDGIRWVSIPFQRRSLEFRHEVQILLRLFRFYLHERPGLVHQFTIKPVFYGSLVAKFLRVPGVVNSITGMGYFFLSNEDRVNSLRKFVFPLYKFAMANPRLRVIFENSSDQTNFLQRGLVRHDRVRLIEGVGVDLSRFSPLVERDGPIVVVMASRMLWDKGVREFVEAASSLKSRHPSVRFVLVGAPDPGNPTTIEEAQLYRWVQDGVIEWWGHRTDMPEVFMHTHIVALPSYSEGLATVLLEAAASQRAIVATDIPGCREVVKDGVNGYLVPVGDKEALAKGIERLILDREGRIRMGKAGRKMVEERFNQQLINQKTISIYRELLG